MRYMKSIFLGFITFAVASFALMNLLPDQIWGLNIGMIVGVLAGVGYFYFKEYRQQERIEDLVDANN